MAAVQERPVIKEEKRPVVCFRCGQVLGLVEAEWTREGMAQFREKAAALKREHVCGPQDTRN